MDNIIKYNPLDFNKDKIIQIFFEFNILKNNLICQHCNKLMKLIKLIYFIIFGILRNNSANLTLKIV